MAMTSSDCYKDVGGDPAAYGTRSLQIFPWTSSWVHGAPYIILDCQKEMNDRGSCKYRGRIHKNEIEKGERAKRWTFVWTLKLAHSGDFWLTSLDRQQQEGERNKGLRRRGEVNKEKWCNVFHLFILVATQRLEAAWLRRTSSHWQPEARWVSADLIATHGTCF
jgi:hypothetical protein